MYTIQWRFRFTKGPVSSLYTIQWRLRFTKVLSPVCTLNSEGLGLLKVLSPVCTLYSEGLGLLKVLSPVCTLYSEGSGLPRSCLQYVPWALNTCCWSLVDSSLIDNMLICWDRLCVQGRMNKLGSRIQCLEWIDGVTRIGGG